jgi:2-oxo-hept-3-ene-1,7-dioate hydratase
MIPGADEMLDRDTIVAIAKKLHAAERERRVTRQITLDHPDISIADSYAVQDAWLALKAAEGRVQKGRKIGLTSRAMQSAIGVHEPDYGVLLDDMFFSPGADIPSDRFIAPKIEVELAFVLSRNLSGPACTMFDVLNATDFVVPALEIIDSRVQRVDPATGVNKKIQDNICDNAGNAAIVVGGRPIRPMEFDLRWISALLYRNGQIEESGVAAAVLNHPANGIAWLANTLFAHDVALPAGEIILSGSFTRPVDARRGDAFHVEYSTLGSIACRFV